MILDASAYIGRTVCINIPVSSSESVGFFGSPFSFFTVKTGGKVLDRQQFAFSDRPQAYFPYPVEVGGDGLIELTFYDEPDGTPIGDPPFCRHIFLSDAPTDAETLYSEPLRPLVHFTPSRGYMNDPNGLTCFNGLWYMFFQLNPYGLSHGNTHWGLAVSSDLLHWKELPPALAPDDRDGSIFSGSGVIDYANSSGMQTGSQPPFFLFYTATGMRFRPNFKRDPETGRPIYPENWVRRPCTQRAAVSLDGGKTFSKLPGEPLVEQIVPMNRDPKVVWNRSADAWVMALYLSGNDYTLLFSEDLLHWERGGTFTFDGTAECPDIFELPLDGDPQNRKWVFLGSPENYVVGHFEGRSFVAETPLIKGCTQPDIGVRYTAGSSPVYAPQTFSGEPDGRIIQISWMPTVFPAMNFQSQMSLPWELSLVTTPSGPRLRKRPAAECDALRGAFVADVFTDPGRLHSEAFDLCFTAAFDSPASGGFALSVRGELIVYDHALRRLTFPTGDYALPFADDATVDFRMICDRGSIELFSCGGLFNCAESAVLDKARLSVEVLYARGCRLSGGAYPLSL